MSRNQKNQLDGRLRFGPTLDFREGRTTLLQAINIGEVHESRCSEETGWSR